ncbi:hypothetical protein Rt10032_c38g6908 [Rhodotorula toruloides]|uniref:Thiamine pyrophosphate enzyme TPP-binding domain-containing protein n=1 Tax=Rhodotorula toruloides TaxID=5286 RepID=A0A511KR93_RHOTO|nr:hypothetical protein Rt10032_c38g6908 [Rhodotorula toruloides]
MFAPAARAAAAAGKGGIIHFEIQPKNVNKVVNANVAIMGDVLDSVRALLPLLPKEAQPRNEWFAKIKQWKHDYPFTYIKSDPTTAGATLARGSRRRSRYDGLRTAVVHRAKVAAPEKIVVDVDGDASFSMTAMELATASQYNIGVKFSSSQRFQGMVLQWQDLFYEKRAADLPAKMKEFMEYDNNSRLSGSSYHKNEHVTPMIAAGKALHQVREPCWGLCDLGGA